MNCAGAQILPATKSVERTDRPSVACRIAVCTSLRTSAAPGYDANRPSNPAFFFAILACSALINACGRNMPAFHAASSSSLSAREWSRAWSIARLMPAMAMGDLAAISPASAKNPARTPVSCHWPFAVGSSPNGLQAVDLTSEKLVFHFLFRRQLLAKAIVPGRPIGNCTRSHRLLFGC